MKKSFLLSFLLAVICTFAASIANAQTWFRESFEVAGVPPDTIPANWTQGKVAGVTAYLNGNGFRRFTASSYPSIVGGFSGTGFLRFNNRGAAYPTVGAGWNVPGDAAFLATPPLDWTGRLATNNDTLSLRFYRSSASTIPPNGGTPLLQNSPDSISVYLNDRADLTGAILLTEIGTGSTFIPRSSSMAPVGTANAWNLLRYQIPAFGAYGGRFDTSSTVYLVIKATSQGHTGVGPVSAVTSGDNMYIDSVSIPTYPTAMDIQGAQIFQQVTADVGKSTTDNLIIGIRIWAHGSLTPLAVDSLSFTPNGSTNALVDITNVKLFYTGSSQSFTTSGTQFSVNKTTGTMNFSYNTSACPFPVIGAGVPLCKPGWNYYWLTYDIPATAVAGHCVDADFTGYNYNSNSRGCGGFRTVNLTASGCRQIDQAYTIPTYTAGTSWAGYTNNDYVSAVETINGQNSSLIDNWYHDTWVGAPCPAYCDRFSPHPPDYTQFQNQAVVTTHKQRGPVLVNEGQGVRSATPSLILHAAPGTWYANDCIAVFVDWNKDGDFYDSYNGGGPGGAISENYGTFCLSAGIIANPFGVGNPFGTWSVEVPSKNDVCANGAGIAPNNLSGGPLFLGNVRLRVREVYYNSNIHPIQSGFTWGEVEDYTINVQDNCPTPNTYVCKWIGNTASWGDPNNWCPGIPDIHRMAYIPKLSLASGFYYPVVDSGTYATCRTLKIMDSAMVTVDLPNTFPGNVPSGSLTVADSIIIGAGVTNSGASLRVKSQFTQQVEIPSASAPIPTGAVYNNYTPFKVQPNSKFQVAYTANELYNVFGLKGGDVVDQLMFYLKTTPASIATYPNGAGGFRIVAYFMSAPVAYPASPLTSGVPVAIKNTSPNYISSSVVYSGTFNITNLLPSLTLTLTPNSFIWDGTSNLVLSFEYWGAAAPAVGYSALYCELGNATNQVLYLTNNTGAGSSAVTQAGFNLDGVATPHASTSGGTINYRPRIDFITHRRYGRSPITVGKAIVNNNNSGAPVGANGFIAGNSKVKFDPSIRAAVSSLGLATLVNQWNPTAQTQFLTADTMKISSGINPVASGAFTIGVSSTVFNELEIVGTAGAPVAGSILKQFKNTYADTLTLTSGELNLNQNTFTLKNPAITSLTAPAGWIKSEDNNAVISSLYTWKIGTNTGTHTIPFGKSNTDIFPIVYNGSTGDVGDLTVGTYGTPNTNNSPLPSQPISISNMNNPTGNNIALQSVDRFWLVKRSTSSAITNTVSFKYNTSTEGTANANYTSGSMKAYRNAITGSTNSWEAPLAGQTDNINGSVVSVTVPLSSALVSTDQIIWSVVNGNSCTIGQPVISANGPTTFCSGDSVTLTSTTATTYLWSTGATTKSIKAKTSGSYYVTVSDNVGCSSQSVATVVTASGITATITANGSTTFCQNDSVQLTCTAAATYAWSNGKVTQSIYVKGANTYYVVAANVNGCTALSNSITTTVNTLPTATITPGGATTFCNGGSVNLTSSTGASYLWSTGASTKTINVNSSGTYTVTVTKANGCTKSSSPVAVNVVQPATPVITPNGSTNICTGSSVTLTSSAASGYVWSTGATTQSIIVSTAGSFTVTITDGTGCTASSVPVAVTIANFAATISSSGSTNFCQGDSVTLTCSSALSYTWSNGATTQSIVAKTAGSYFVVASYAGGCTALSNTISVTVKTLPNATITPSGATTFCQGGSVTLSSNAGASYLWSTGAITQSIVVSTSGTFTVTVTNANGCSKKSNAVVVTVTSGITASISANGPTTFCSGGSVTLTSNSATNYLWSNSATTQSIVVATSGSYVVMITGAGGCTALSNNINVTVTQAVTPTISATGPLNFCPGQSVILTSTPASSYLWSTGIAAQSIAVNSSGAFVVTITDGNGCTASSAVTTVTVSCPKPTGLTSTNITATSGKTNWNVVSCALSYRLQYRVNGTLTWTTASGILNNYKNITGLLASTQYDWHVSTKCPDGTFSTYTAIQNFTTTTPREGDAFGVEEINAINLFPNPGTDIVYLQSENPIEAQSEVSVYDMTGRKIAVGVSKTDSQTFEINIQSLAEGAYMVVLTTTSTVQKKKLIVAR